MNILLVSNLLPPEAYGGYEMRAYEIGKLLKARGHNLTFVTSKFSSRHFGRKTQENEVFRIFTYIPPSPFKNWFRAIDRLWNRFLCSAVGLRNYKELRLFLTNRTFDLAYIFNTERIGVATCLAIQERGIPLVWHAGDNYLAKHFGYWPGLSPLYQIFHRVFLGKVNAMEQKLDFSNFLLVSNFLKEEFIKKGFRMRNPVVISRPITTRILDKPYAPSLPPFFFMACRIDAQKGIHIVLEACHLLHKTLPNQEWSLLFAGASRNSYLNQLSRKVKKYGLDKRIKYLGRISRDEVILKMQKAIAFVNAPIYGEPFAGTVLEAIANNAPLLTSNDGSALEVVKPGLTCLVHEKFDAPSLARNMQSILCEPDLAARISAAAKADVLGRFGTEIILDKTEAYLKDAILSSPLKPI